MTETNLQKWNVNHNEVRGPKTLLNIQLSFSWDVHVALASHIGLEPAVVKLLDLVEKYSAFHLLY